jgi:2-C-methyl-D-erythritol 4-phosphate cytidylyltransferase
VNSPWLNTEDAAEYLRYTGTPKNRRRSVYKFIERHGIIVRHDGRRVLISRADIERVLDLRHQLHGSQPIDSAASAGSPH